MFKKVNLGAIFLLICISVATSIPTSVLIKDSQLGSNIKVKRESSDNHPSEASAASSSSSGDDSLKTVNDKSEVPLTSGNGNSVLQKRDIDFNVDYSRMAKGGIYSPEQIQAAAAAYNKDFWNEEEPFRLVPQSLPAEETMNEPIKVPLYRSFGEYRKKRSYKYNKYGDMPLKHETQLTPADMLALVALVEAGERSHQNSELEDLNKNSGDYLRPMYYPAFEYPSAGQNNKEESEYANAWLEPSMLDYYGMPYNLESVPKYEVVRDNKLNANRYPSKRFMVSKKKRSLGHFLNEPVAVPNLSYVPSSGSNKHSSYY